MSVLSIIIIILSILLIALSVMQIYMFKFKTGNTKAPSYQIIKPKVYKPLLAAHFIFLVLMLGNIIAAFYLNMNFVKLPFLCVTIAYVLAYSYAYLSKLKESITKDKEFAMTYYDMYLHYGLILVSIINICFALELGGI